MEKDRMLLIGAGLILALVVVAILFSVFSSPSLMHPQKPLGAPKSCQGIDMASREMAAEISYCLGDACSIVCEKAGCHAVTTQAECEKIDIVRSDLLPGQDGSPDCAWANSRCRPSK